MDFFTFARLHGLIIKDTSPSQRIRRCGVEDKPTSKVGAYFWDGDRGWVMRWDQDLDYHWWDDPDRKPPTREELAARDFQRQEYERKQAAKWGATALRCRMLQESTKMTEHDYMHRKGLGDVLVGVLPEMEMTNSDTGEIKKVERLLFVPMLNWESDALVGAQLIYWDGLAMVWEKTFVHGSRLKDSFYHLGPRDVDEVVLCEGYATGHSIKKALLQANLRATVLVCFNDSNMVNIAKLLPGGVRAYVFADNDKSRAGERAARATGLPFCMSPVEGEDANDMHKRAGLFPVQALLMKTRKECLRVPVDNTTKD